MTMLARPRPVAWVSSQDVLCPVARRGRNTALEPTYSHTSAAPTTSQRKIFARSRSETTSNDEQLGQLVPQA